ncbi:MAG: mechanosensitive ion channel domain-containing protein [Candidatus Omnitrophota bacterium]
MKNFKLLIHSIAFGVYSLIITKLAFCQEAKAAPEGFLATELGTAKKLIDMVTEFCVKYSFQVLGGILVLLLGFAIANQVAKIMGRFFESKKIDPPVVKFLTSIVKFIVIALFALIALGKFGITIAPFIAGLSVIGFGTSFALQGPLSNYAAGISLIFTKPFRVGDIIEVTGVMGEVQDMTLARTELKTVDATKIVIPNKQIIGEIIHNYGDFKKLDITVGVSYGSDMRKAIDAVKEVVKNDSRVSQAPEPKVGISEFADSSINIYTRIWCKQAQYWDVMFDINKGIDSTFRKNGINIPFPKRDVHIYNQAENQNKEGGKTWAEYSE